MSTDARSFVRRLHVSGTADPQGRGSSTHKYLLEALADRVHDDTQSWTITTSTLAADCHINERHISTYLHTLMEQGKISVLDRTDASGRQRSGRIFVHGPWDLFGGTGVAFPEVQRPRATSRLDPTPDIELTQERWAELVRRFTAYAGEDGAFSDGRARSRFRIGSRAHAIVCWWGVGRIVEHVGRAAVVAAARERDGRTPIAPQVRLRYAEGESSGWVDVDQLAEPAPAPAPPEEMPSSEGGDSSGTPTGEDPGGRVSVLSPHGVSVLSPHGVSVLSPLSSSASASASSSSVTGTPPGDLGGEEEEEGTTDENRGCAADTAAASADGVVDPVAARVREATGADVEEAAALVEILAEETKKSLSGYVRHLAANGDLSHRLRVLRRDRADQQRVQAPESEQVECHVHRPGHHVPCLPCRQGLADPEERPDILAELHQRGPEVRPDLAALLGADACA